MAQPAPDPLNNTMKPITLTILPQPTSQQVLGPVPTSSVHVSGTTERYSPPIPNFNHVPIQPTIVPSPAYIVGKINRGEEQRIERQRQSNKDHQKKYRDRTKVFTQIAHLPSINERIKRVWLLTYPDLNIDEHTMDILIAQFVSSMLNNGTQ